MKTFFRFQFLPFLFLILISNPGHCGSEVIGKLFPIKGTSCFGGVIPIKITGETDLKNGDLVKTGPDCSIKAVYSDQSSIIVSPESTVTFKRNSVVLQKGKSRLHFYKKGREFRIYTPSACLGLIGTGLEVEVVDRDLSVIEVTEGRIWVEALFGNRKKIQLEEGYLVRVTGNGIVEEPEKSMSKVQGNGEDAGTEKPTQAVAPESLDMDGPYTIKVMPVVINVPYRLFIDGYSSYNGTELKFNKPEPFTFKVEEGTYRITLLASGIEHSFQVEVSDNNPILQKVLTYAPYCITPTIHGLNGTSNSQERLKHMKYTVIHAGKRTPLHYWDPKEQKHHGLTVYLEGSNLMFGNVFFLPENIEEYPVIEAEYTGSLPVKVKKHKVQIVPDKKMYEINF